MKMKFIVKTKYGQTMLYPACELSDAFLKAQGLKIFTNQAITICKVLGIELVQTHESVII